MIKSLIKVSYFMRVSFSNANNKEETVAADHGKTKSTIR